MGFCCFFFFLPKHRSWLGFYLATQNNGFSPEWTFPANTFIFRHNCSSVPPDERSLRKCCLWKGPSPEFSEDLQRGMELLGFFAVLFLHASFPPCPLLSKQRPRFLFFLTLPTSAKSRLRHPEALLPWWMVHQELFVLQHKRLWTWQTHPVCHGELIKTQIIYQCGCVKASWRWQWPNLHPRIIMSCCKIKTSQNFACPSCRGARKMIPLDALNFWTRRIFLFFFLQESHRKFIALSHICTTKRT